MYIQFLAWIPFRWDPKRYATIPTNCIYSFVITLFAYFEDLKFYSYVIKEYFLGLIE